VIHCPHCGWPANDLPTSTHRTSQGTVHYRRCVCGAWLVHTETLIATTRTTFISNVQTQDEVRSR